MFVAKIEVWPHGRHWAPSHHTTIVGFNDGTGDHEVGNYGFFTVCGELSPDEILRMARSGAVEAKVKDFPRGRDQAHLPSLVAEGIIALGLGEYVRQ